MGSFKIFTILAVGVVGSVAMAKPVAGTLIASQVRNKISAEGLQNLENARMACLQARQTCLNPQSESVWQDPTGENISGAFKILGYYLNPDNQKCVQYQHEFRQNGQPILHDTEASKQPRQSDSILFGTPLVGKSYACEITPNQWEKYEGDDKKLAGKVGPEHRNQYRDMVGPFTVSRYLNIMNYWKQKVDGQATEAGKQFYRNEMFTLTVTPMLDDPNKGGLRVSNKTLALDQLAIILEPIEGDEIKLKIVETLTPVLVRIGDAAKQKGDIDRLLSQVQSKAKKNQLKQLLRPCKPPGVVLKCLPLVEPTQSQPAS